MIMKPNTELEKLLGQMDAIALKEVERLARKVLKEHPNLDEFIMCMGSYFFTYKDKTNKDHLSGYEQRVNKSWQYYTVDSRAYLKPLNNFISKWNEVLKITGEPMRFTAEGPIITDW